MLHTKTKLIEDAVITKVTCDHCKTILKLNDHYFNVSVYNADSDVNDDIEYHQTCYNPNCLSMLLGKLLNEEESCDEPYDDINITKRKIKHA